MNEQYNTNGNTVLSCLSVWRRHGAVSQQASPPPVDQLVCARCQCVVGDRVCLPVCIAEAAKQRTLGIQGGLASLVLGDLHHHVLLAAFAERPLGLWNVHLERSSARYGLKTRMASGHYRVCNWRPSGLRSCMHCKLASTSRTMTMPTIFPPNPERCRQAGKGEERDRRRQLLYVLRRPNSGANSANLLRELEDQSFTVHPRSPLDLPLVLLLQNIHPPARSATVGRELCGTLRCSVWYTAVHMKACYTPLSQPPKYSTPGSWGSDLIPLM